MTERGFDVFLSHNSQDKPVVREIWKRLRARGLRPWLDEVELVPGRPWQEEIEAILSSIPAAMVCVGTSGLGPWERPEMRASLEEFVRRQIPVIPVLLPGAATLPELPLFLQAFTWVDLREGLSKEGIDRLVYGITGSKPVAAGGEEPGEATGPPAGGAAAGGAAIAAPGLAAAREAGGGGTGAGGARPEDRFVPVAELARALAEAWAEAVKEEAGAEGTRAGVGGAAVRRGGTSRAQQRARGTWIFSGVLLAILVVVVVLGGDRVPRAGQPIVAVFAALLAGLMTYFLTGDLGLRLPWLRGTGGMGVFALVLLLWPKLVPPAEDYRVRVTVLGPQGEVAEDAVVSSVPAGVTMKGAGSWEIDISASALAQDRKVRVIAKDPKTLAVRMGETTLEKDHQPVVTIQLPPESLAQVSGHACDGRTHDGNCKVLGGVKVSVKDHEEEAVTTGAAGEFSLPAHVPVGTMVMLTAEKQGWKTKVQGHPAGVGPARLFLDPE